MFENLEVEQAAVDFADEIAALAKRFPRGRRFLVDQLNRATPSIATNLADGNGQFTKPDRRNLSIIARSSVRDCMPLVEVARRCGLVPEQAARALRERLEVIAKMISGLINGLDKREA